MDPVTSPRLDGDFRVDVAELGPLRTLPWPDAGNSTMFDCTYRGQPYLFKRYTDEFRREADAVALSRMIAWRDGISPADRHYLDLVAAWPRYRVEEAGALVGVLIPIAARHFLQPDQSGGPARPRVLSRLIRYRASGRDIRGASQRVKQRALGNAIEVLLWLHSRNVLVNDVHVGNILCTEDGHAVYFVDCDSMMGPKWGAVAEPAAPETIRVLVPEASAPTAMTDMVRFAWAALWVLMDSFDAQPVTVTHVGRIVARPTAEFLLSASKARRCDPVPVDDWRRLAGRWLNDGKIVDAVRVAPPAASGQPGPTRALPALDRGARLPHAWVPPPYRWPVRERTMPRRVGVPVSAAPRRRTGLSPRAIAWLAAGAVTCLAILLALVQGAVR